MLRKVLLLALPVVAVAAIGSSVAKADLAGALGAVIGQQSGGYMELIGHRRHHVSRKRGRGYVARKRGRAWAVTRGRGLKRGLHKQGY
jgi:hypothetical protein